MSAAASPGRTWPGFVAERRVPVLAAAAAAPVLHGGCRVARVPDMGRAPSSAYFTYMGGQDDSRGQLDAERYGDRGLDRDLDPVSVKGLLKLRKPMLLLPALLLASTLPVSAQVEKVAMRTSGISCGVCAVVSEVNFKRMPGVDKVVISLSQEAIMLTYKPGAVFSPKAIRDVLEPLKVGVDQFQISARGRVQEQGGKRFFLAGKDRFLLTATASVPAIPPDTPVLIEGILNDHAQPMEVRVLNFRPLQQ